MQSSIASALCESSVSAYDRDRAKLAEDTLREHLRRPAAASGGRDFATFSPMFLKKLPTENLDPSGSLKIHIFKITLFLFPPTLTAPPCLPVAVKLGSGLKLTRLFIFISMAASTSWERSRQRQREMEKKRQGWHSEWYLLGKLRGKGN